MHSSDHKTQLIVAHDRYWNCSSNQKLSTVMNIVIHCNDHTYIKVSS